MAFTFFFRDSHTLNKVIDFLLPYVSGFRKVKIWDAGCAMGPEPYTFAIMLAERMSSFAFKNVFFDVSDIDETENFGKTITDGIYPEADLKRMPEGIFEKYFHPTEREGFFKIDENIRSRMLFRQHDLLTLKPFDNNYHLIICKNVLLHFSPDQRVQVIKMYHSCLAEGGLFTTEKTQPMPEECKGLFELLATDANIYRKISK